MNHISLRNLYCVDWVCWTTTTTTTTTTSRSWTATTRTPTSTSAAVVAAAHAATSTATAAAAAATTTISTSTLTSASSSRSAAAVAATIWISPACGILGQKRIMKLAAAQRDSYLSFNTVTILYIIIKTFLSSSICIPENLVGGIV